VGVDSPYFISYFSAEFASLTSFACLLCGDCFGRYWPQRTICRFRAIFEFFLILAYRFAALSFSVRGVSKENPNLAQTRQIALLRPARIQRADGIFAGSNNFIQYLNGF